VEIPDFTEGHFAVKIDPTGGLLTSFIDLNEFALTRFSIEERNHLGGHASPGEDSPYDADLEHSLPLPSILALNVAHFDIARSRKEDRARELKLINKYKNGVGRAARAAEKLGAVDGR
jgi:5-methyltetrahydropteroyltriglutamate--homocysteine methyltransferase